ncbi:MarR family winged helix-turn-helix transcriptional regulator [Levilactobacillus huananensis]|uniref:MarR family winged helix-turn-helix transcriptional regulator n=1 Tax=Levilactobacillus huananensis TaxID=2486019 RepID=UPI000F7AF3B3|nr:MarR family winged helix-turn-helix transcriptional regulator [Levilactobacillus huananensis]
MVEEAQLRQLTQIYGLVTKCYNQPLASLDLNLPQCELLNYVAVDQLTVAQAAERLGFSATRTSNLVVDLCKRGYLSQRVISCDRRRRYLTLTPAGEKQLAVIQRELPDQLAVTLQHLKSTAVEENRQTS